MTTTTHGQRKTGIELLRILAMLMVVGIHYLNFGGLRWSDAVWNRRLGWLLEAFGFVCIDCYALISGYFLVTASSFSWKKVAKLWGHVVFYTLLFLLLAVLFTGYQWGSRDIIHALLPVRYRTYWFVTAYVGVYLLSPYLGRLARSLSKREYQSFLALLLGMFSVYSFLRQDADPFFMQGGYTVWWLVVLFFLGGYIRLYLERIPLRTSLALYVGMCLLTFISKKPVFYLFQAWGIPTGHFFGFYNYNSPTIIVAAVALFAFCLHLPELAGWIGRAIRCIGPLSFGVYLIHENPFVRRELWGHWVHTQSMYHSSWLAAHFVATVLGIFIACVIIDALRAKLAGAVMQIWRRLRESW